MMTPRIESGRFEAGDTGPSRPVRFDALLASLSSRFVNLPPGDVDGAIDDALRRICEPLGVDFAALWEWSTDESVVLTLTHVYLAEGGPPGAAIMLAEHFPWVSQQMRAGITVALSSLEQLPAEAAVDRESAERLLIKSSLVLPLSVGGSLPTGVLAFNTVRAPREWSDELVDQLQLVAQVFANALARRRHDLILRESEERLALAVDAAEAGLWTLNLGTGVFWATERARALFGYSPDETLDMARFEASVHPDDWGAVREPLERAARTGESFDVVYRIVHAADGRLRWISSRGGRPVGLGPTANRLTGVSIDITDRRVTEEALRVGQARLQAAAELARLGSVEVDEATGTVFADDRSLDILGYPPEGERGMPIVHFWMEHLHPDDLPRVLGERREALDGKREELRVEYRYLHPVRGERWIQHIGRSTWRDAAGFAVRSVAVLRDITEGRQREEALRQSLEEIARLKDRLEAERDYLKAEVGASRLHEEITGQSAAIRKVLRQAEQVAPTPSSVLVLGETGTGKERLAQCIHRLSPRHHQVMVKVNCAALPAGLIESELFGREKGAYTGAMARQVGRFEIAHGSTLFLDEIGELPLELQSKLLRVLESGEFERLGGPRTIKVDVRIIAATNRDLADDVRKGRFREDLYYRLNVFPIRVPPLRERKEDIPPLVWAILGELNARMGKRITQVSRKTMEALQRQAWPGNVRELRNILEHAVIVTAGETLAPPVFDAARPAAAGQTLAESERDHILGVLERTGWRIKGAQGAAEVLGLKRGTLYGRMRKLGIPFPASRKREP